MDIMLAMRSDIYILSHPQKKDVQEALILTATDAVHVVYWFLINGWHLFRSQVKA